MTDDPLLPLISHENDSRGPTDDLLLRKHLTDVSERAVDIGPPTSTDAATVIKACGVLHDFGKATPEFQQYIRSDVAYSGPEYARHHSRLGAMATFHALRAFGLSERSQLVGFLAVARHHGRPPDLIQYLKEDVLEYERQNEVVTQQVQSIDSRWPSVADDLLRQSTDGRVEWPSFREYVCSGGLLSDLDEIVSVEYFGTSELSTAAIDDELYNDFYAVWTALTFADKTHAAEILDAALEPKPLASPPLTPLTNHIKGLQQQNGDQSELECRLNRARERARQDAHARLSEIEGIPDPYGQAQAAATVPDVLSLPLSTGLGKTFTGLSVGIDLQDRIRRSSSETSRPPIIYALPYTSIIEQTRQHIEDPDIWGADPRSQRFTVHHHLSETVTDRESGRSQPNAHLWEDGSLQKAGPAALLGQTWRSGLVLTTFVQLFESVTRPSSSSGMKGTSLRNAVIILDEPQALPVRWWPAIRRACQLLTDRLGATIISMTATQPAIFAGDDIEMASLTADDRGQSRPERVQYQIQPSVWSYANSDVPADAPISYQDAGRSIINSVETGTSSALAICNTVASAQTLYSEISEHDGLLRPAKNILEILRQHNRHNPLRSSDSEWSSVDLAPDYSVVANELIEELNHSDQSKSQPAVVCLTGDHRPYDRRVLIRLIEELTTDKRPFITVSTQVVEAGVDVSFEQVFRDIAPPSSIVQAAGRCNRSYEWGEQGGTVTLWRLSAPDNGFLPGRIYERDGLKDHLELTADVLRDAIDAPDEASECELDQAVETYYDRLESRDVGDQELIDWINEFQGRSLADERLIENPETIDVVVPKSPAERRVVEQAQQAFETENQRRGYALIELLQECRVSVRTETVNEMVTSELSAVDGSAGYLVVHNPESSDEMNYETEHGFSSL